MKKILIGLIIILCILLITQSIYFNFTKKTNISNVNNNINLDNKTIQSNISNSNQIEEEKIESSGLDDIMNKYEGEVSIEIVKEELIKFTDTNMQNMYLIASGKSNNKILQIYDLQEEDINEMNIYSGEDFLGIVSQIFLVGNIKNVKCTSYIIEEETVNFDDNGYTSFDVTLKFDSLKEIKLKLYLANNETKNPILKFENVE